MSLALGLALLFGLFIVVPFATQVPYLAATYRFRTYAAAHGWNPPDPAEDMLTKGPVGFYRSQMAGQEALEAAARSGQLGPEGAALLARLEKTSRNHLWWGLGSWLVDLAIWIPISKALSTASTGGREWVVAGAIAVFGLIAAGMSIATRRRLKKARPELRRRLLLTYIVGLGGLAFGGAIAIQVMAR